MRASRAPSTSRRAWLAVFAVACLAVVGLAPARAAWEQQAQSVQSPSNQVSAAELWFGPYPYGMPGPPNQVTFGADDYMDLFEPGAPWTNGLADLGVFQFYFAWVLGADPADLDKAVDFLTAEGIDIAVEVPVLELQPDCGTGAEGFVEDPAQIILDVLDAITAAGGSVRWLVMQEPYTFASPTYSGPGACFWSPSEVAEHVAGPIGAVRAAYPNAAFGTVESDHVSPGELAAFADAYAAETTEPLSFFHLDVDWQFRSDWPHLALATEALMDVRGIPFGMIYNGFYGDTSDADWNQHATERFHEYEEQWGGTPQQAKFQSWHKHPQHLLPETDSAAMTALLSRYRDLRASISVSVGPNTGGARTASVEATDGNGTPLIGVPVEVRFRPVDGPGVEGTYTVTGTVPAGAARAFVGFRVNTECNCGYSDSYFSFYEGSFKEGPSFSERVPNASFQSGLGAWYVEDAATYQPASGVEPNRVRVDAPAAQRAFLNSAATTGTLTPGRPFTATFRARVDPRSVGSGYFSVVFVTTAWAEVARYRIPIEPAWTRVSGTTGGAVPLAGLPPARLEVVAEYPAGPAYSVPLAVDAATPDITGFSPATIAEGSGATVLSVLGTGFNHDSVLSWDGEPRTTTLVSASELRMTLTATDVLTSGNSTVGVTTPAPGGGTDSMAFSIAPRVITISGAPTVNEGTTYTLNLAATYPGENIDRWRIDWGDGQVQTITGDPPSVTHVFADGPATRTITAEARDGGTYHPASAPVVVSVLNVAPTVTVGGPSSVAEGQSYALTFSRTDPGAESVQSWSVDWGDGTPVSVLAANATGASHTYADGPATPSIQVSVTDDDGAYLASPKEITVSNVAPTVTISGPSTVFAGASYTLSLVVADPGSDSVASWQINWGDGPPQTVTGNPISVSHVYGTAPATHLVSATAIDEDGAHTSNQLTVNVYNVAPPLTIDGSPTVDEGAPYALSLDSGASFVTSWTIDWGDGTLPEVVAGDPSSATHIYADGPAAHTVTATATDGVDTWPSNSINVTVVDVGPTISVSGSGSVDEGSTYTVTFDATDPGDDSTTGWSIDWGDGSSPSLVPGNSASAQHVYADGPADHDIVVTVVQGDESFAADPHMVAVLDVAPTVSVNGPGSVVEGGLYTLTLSASDPGADPVTSWQIDWGDGVTDTVNGSPSSAGHVYADGPASLVVTASAFQGTDEFLAGTVSVSVMNVPPSIALDGPVALREQHPYVLGVAITDPGDDTVAGWTVDWGDGTEPESLPAEESTAGHTYATGGVARTITVTVADEDGPWVATRQVNVLGPPSLSVSGPASTDEGTLYQLTLTLPPADITGWSIDWGDGSPISVVPAEASVVEHTYADGPASHTIQVEGTDGYGSWPANTIFVTIDDVPPTLVVSGPSSAVVSQTYSLSLDWTDSGSDTVTEWSIDWGDGSAPVTIPGLSSTASHVFGAPGSRSIVATAHQGSESWAAPPVVVEVDVPPAPSLTALSHTSIEAGGAGFMLEVTGQSFGGATIWLGGAEVPTSVVTQELAVAEVPAAAIAVPGVLAVAVHGPGGISDSLPLVVTAAGSGRTWYFAEGFTDLGWQTQVRITNATAAPATVQIEYLLDGEASVVRQVEVARQSHRVVSANDTETGPGDGFAFGLRVTSDVPITVEESMFAGEGDFAHSTTGAQQLSTQWFFAEGFTISGWETFVLLANPSASPANVTVSYNIQDGSPVTVTRLIPPGQRTTAAGHVDVPDSAFSVTVTSDVGIVAEMAMYDTARLIAHRTLGLTLPSTSWQLAEGFTGFGWETFISVGNPGDVDVTATATYTLDGVEPIVRTLLIPARSRGTFIAHELASGVGRDQAFGLIIESSGPVVVQEVMIDPAAGASRANTFLGASTATPVWSFAGGMSLDGWSTFYALANPGDTPVTVDAVFYLADGEPPARASIVVPPRSRRTMTDGSVGSETAFGVLFSGDGAFVVAQATYDESSGRAYSASGVAGP